MTAIQKPTILLDIDDVLCMSVPYGGYDVIDAFAGRRTDIDHVLAKIFSTKALDVLRRAHDRMGGDVSYVISSTWRQAFDRDAMVMIFNGAGAGFIAESLLPGDAWCTTVIPGDDMRAQEIELWIRTHGRGEPFVILDDTHSGKSLVGAKADSVHPWHWRVVMCDEFVGLVDEHVGEIVAALRRPVAPDGPSKQSLPSKYRP